MTDTIYCYKDAGGGILYCPQPTSTVYQFVLDAGVAQDYTLPEEEGTYAVFFSYSPGSEVWVSFTGTAVVPGASGDDLVYLFPQGRALREGTTVSVVTADENVRVGLEIWKIQQA